MPLTSVARHNKVGTLRGLLLVFNIPTLHCPFNAVQTAASFELKAFILIKRTGDTRASSNFLGEKQWPKEKTSKEDRRM